VQQTCYAKYLNWQHSGMFDRVRKLLAHKQTNTPCCPTLGSSAEDLIETV
jgi:hypothetical protein